MYHCELFIMSSAEERGNISNKTVAGLCIYHYYYLDFRLNDLNVLHYACLQTDCLRVLQGS
jgi:hypothetical protein